MTGWSKWLTLECFCLKDLAAGLVLKLIVLTQEVLTKGAAEDSPSYQRQKQRWAVSVTLTLWGGGGGGRWPYHDPRHCAHIRCSLHRSGDTHRHECWDIFDCGTPRPRRSRTLLPCDQEQKHRRINTLCPLVYVTMLRASDVLSTSLTGSISAGVIG